MSDEDNKDKAVVEQGALAGNQSDTQTTEEKQQEEAAKEINQTSNASGETMHVRVAAPFREYFDGQAFSISAINLT